VYRDVYRAFFVREAGWCVAEVSVAQVFQQDFGHCSNSNGNRRIVSYKIRRVVDSGSRSRLLGAGPSAKDGMSHGLHGILERAGR
jgi:hypothetical protein